MLFSYFSVKLGYPLFIFFLYITSLGLHKCTFFFNVFIHMFYVYVGLPTCMSVKHMSAVLQDQQKVSDPLELVVQTGKSLPMVMGRSPGSLGDRPVLLTTDPSQPPMFSFVNNFASDPMIQSHENNTHLEFYNSKIF